MNDNDCSQDTQVTPYAWFFIKGEVIDPDELTEILGITPNYKYRKGDHYGLEKDRTQTIGFWSISSRKIIQSDNIESHMDWILIQLESVKKQLDQFVFQDGVETRLTIVFNLYVHEWSALVNSNLLKRISDLNLRLGISIYYLEDFDERLNRENP
jgi:hypothetical protein